MGEADVTLTVCTGAFALAKTSLVEGKSITTHFGALAGKEDLKARALYNRACALARAGKSVDALSALRDAVKSGSFPRAAVEQDPDFDSLHGKLEFEAIFASMDRKS